MGLGKLVKLSLLENLLNNSSYNIKRSYTLCHGNVECVNYRIYLPIYLIMFFNNKKDVKSQIVNIDVSMLKQKLMVE